MGKGSVKVQMIRESRSAARFGATALVAVALFLAVDHAADGDSAPPDSIDPSPAFTITSTISSSVSSQIPALLFPGTQRYLWYTAYNPEKVPITVNLMRISDVSAPSGCPRSNLNYSLTTFTGSLDVPAGGANEIPVPISLYDTNTNQDACEGVTFTFTYSGTATYDEVYSTVTEVDSSQNPSLVGDGVTYIATVAAVAVAGQDPVPSSPTGVATFLDGSIDICTSVPVAPITDSVATATCSPPEYAGSATHEVTVAYTNSDGNFTDSTSEVLSQVVTP